MDLLAHYNDDSLNQEDSPSEESEKKEAKKADLSLEDEWLSFEKMISDQPPGQTNSDSGSSQYLVQGMVAYPGMSSQLAPKQVSSAPEVEDSKHLDDSSDEDAKEEKIKNEKGGEEKPGDKANAHDDDYDAFLKMRKKVKERDHSSSSDDSDSDSEQSGSLSPPQLSPVHSENSQHSLPPPELFDPTEDTHYKSAEHSPKGSPVNGQDASPTASTNDQEKADKEPQPLAERLKSIAETPIEEEDIKQAAKSNDRKSSRDSKRRPSHRSRSRSKHRESSRRHKSRSRSKGRRHRHPSKDRHRHRRRKSRDRKRSQSKERKRSKSREKKTEDKEKSSKRRSKSRERKRSKSKDRKQSRSRSKGRERKKSEKERRRRSRSKDKERKRRERSSDRKRRHSSRSKSRDRKRKHSSRSRSRDRLRSRSRSRERLRSRSPVYGKKMTFKDKMRNELINAGKRADDKAAAESSTSGGGSSSFSPGELLKASALASLKSNNSSVTPQMALLQTMAVMHQKAQEITGVAVPKYYNPAAVNPLKYAEQVQKRKLLWSKKGDDKEKEKEVQLEGQWKSSQFTADQDGKMSSKFRKLMGMKDGDGEEDEEVPSELSEEQKRKQEELFSRLDKEYEFARMATHTHRGVGLGFSSQVQFPSSQPPH